MDEREESAATAENPNHPPFCQECELNPAKYTCPGCSLRSCSLPCVKAHKQHTGCTGKRQQTQCVPLSQFDDDLLLHGTFFFLLKIFLLSFLFCQISIPTWLFWRLIMIRLWFHWGNSLYFFLDLRLWYVSPFWRFSLGVYCYWLEQIFYLVFIFEPFSFAGLSVHSWVCFNLIIIITIHYIFWLLWRLLIIGIIWIVIGLKKLSILSSNFKVSIWNWGL